MPTTTITAWGRRVEDALQLRVELASGAVIERTVTAAKIDTPEKLAAWVLAQAPERGAEAGELRRQYTVTYHLDAEGAPVVDSVALAALPEEANWAALVGSPLGGVTVAPARAAIAGATDWKPILRSVVRVVIPLRDIVERVLLALRRLGLR
jgi:hypothetical protein